MTQAQASPRGWPEGRPLAISVNVMLEGWEENSAPGIGPMGNPLKPGVLDLQARSWAAYGPGAGAQRILDALVQADVRAAWYVSGILAERHPDLIHAIAEAGHHVAAHAWAQNILPVYQTAEEEERDLDRCIDAIRGACGRSPKGWLSPRCTPSHRTSALVASRGLKWHADMFDSDLPYQLLTKGGPVTMVPFTMEVNDMPLYVRYGNEPGAFSRIFERIATNWRRIGNHRGCLDITVHAHVFGRPFGILELQRTLEIAKACEWAWLADHAAIAALCPDGEFSATDGPGLTSGQTTV